MIFVLKKNKQNLFNTLYLRFQRESGRKAILVNVKDPAEFEKFMNADYLVKQNGQPIDQGQGASVAIDVHDGKLNYVIEKMRQLIQYCSKSS